MVPQLAVWGLFWRALVAALGAMLWIPTPWTNAALYRYLVGNTWLPDGRRLTFAGTGGDIWSVFIGGPLLVGVFAGMLTFLDLWWLVPIVAIPVFGYMNYLIVRWLTDKVGSEDGSVKLEFTGSFWGILGWHLLLIVSVVTIIGWAWVMKDGGAAASAARSISTTRRPAGASCGETSWSDWRPAS